jgi:hypothetical protein
VLFHELASGEPVVGFLLQELAVVEARPEIQSDNGSVCSFACTLQDYGDNRNKRRYSRDVLESAIASPSVQERLRTRTLYGEASHPFDDNMKRQLSIDMTRVSHLVTGLQAGQGSVRGTVQTAATSVGRDMRGLIVENNSTVAFSMRGAGAARRVPGKDLVEVTKPLVLVTYDWVTYPSHASAYMDKGGIAPIPRQEAASWALDQSANVRSLVEQWELESPDARLTEDQAGLILRSGRKVVVALLEADVRAEFRGALAAL